MSVQPPPVGVWQPIEYMFPGIWGRFVRAANASLADIGPGAIVTSWYRTAADNRRVGGDPESQHQLGLAFDVAWSGPTDWELPDSWQSRCRRALVAQGFEVADEGDHVHAQVLKAGQARRLGLFDLTKF